MVIEVITLVVFTRSSRYSRHLPSFLSVPSVDSVSQLKNCYRALVPIFNPS